MKWIKFTRINRYNEGTESAPRWREIPTDVMLSYCEYNEEVAKATAYNGEYTIEDDGETEGVKQPTPEQRIAELEEALELLLSGVTE